MPDMPGLVSRPKLMRLHDSFLNESRENRRKFGLGLLAGDPLVGVYRHLRIGAAPDWRHLEREFYAEDGPLAYWPDNRWGYLGNKEEILRQGILETIRVVEGLSEAKMTRRHFARPWPDVPVERALETWWMCSGSRFEVNVLDGDSQVTMMLLTPAMPELPDSRKVKLENPGFIWTVGHKDRLASYLADYPKQDKYPSLKQPYRVARGNAKARKELRRINKFQE